MADSREDIDGLLLDYLDGSLNEDDRRRVEELLGTDMAVKKRMGELTAMERLVNSMPLTHPSRNFETRVMARIAEKPFTSGFALRNGLFLIIGILAIIFAGASLLSAGVFDQHFKLDFGALTYAQQFLNRSFPSVSIDGKLVMNVIILLNLAIVFVVFDRAILKPLFQKRMQAGH